MIEFLLLVRREPVSRAGRNPILDAGSVSIKLN